MLTIAAAQALGRRDEQCARLPAVGSTGGFFVSLRRHSEGAMISAKIDIREDCSLTGPHCRYTVQTIRDTHP
jgi:hypothetical protein